MRGGLGKPVVSAWQMSLPISQDSGDGALSRAVGFLTTIGSMGKIPLPPDLSLPNLDITFPQFSSSEAGNLDGGESRSSSWAAWSKAPIMTSTHLTKLLYFHVQIHLIINFSGLWRHKRKSRDRLPSRGHLCQRKKHYLLWVHTWGGHFPYWDLSFLPCKMRGLS